MGEPGSAIESSWSRDQAHFVFAGPWKEDVCFYIDLNTLGAFKVDAEVDNLTEDEIYDNWDLVEAADRAVRQGEDLETQTSIRCKEHH